MDQQGQASNPQQPAAGMTPPAPAPDAAMAQPAATPTPDGTMPQAAPAAGMAQQPAAAGTPGAETPAPKKSHTKMLLTILVLLLFVVGGIFAWQTYFNKGTMTKDDAMMKQDVTPTEAVMVSPTDAPVASGDAQLDKQSSTVDNAMEKANQDVTDVDKGLNDTPADLSQ